MISYRIRLACFFEAARRGARTARREKCSCGEDFAYGLLAERARKACVAGGVARLRSPAETAAALAVSPRSTFLGKLGAQNLQATSSSRRAVFP
jgi:hypothetical protein